MRKQERQILEQIRKNALNKNNVNTQNMTNKKM
jgi:hypothetical protein